eukprot:TRINITY_DN33485_c0_g1_i1.p1 TRINITY_DN33485_c0_g1~~TRINITY_DN33485_c0_g1_i1.p1  ORF type:complete len:472 (-),score=26.35 TRINITY_DN33485_c0_g1_i1:155-1570(-)
MSQTEAPSLSPTTPSSHAEVVFPTSAFLSDTSISRPRKTAASGSTSLEAQVYKGRPLAIVTVGLPARGKFYISRKLCRWMNWLGIRSSVFRSAVLRHVKYPGEKFRSEFFDPSNEEAKRIRDDIVSESVAQAIKFLEKGGQVVLIEGQNVTVERRKWIREKLRTVLDEDRIIFLEVYLDDGPDADDLLERSVQTSESYEGVPVEQAMADYRKRQQHYLKCYESVDNDDEADLPWIKYINHCDELICNRVSGYLPTRVANYLMQVNVRFIPIYCTRHGQSEYNTKELLGGDSGLSTLGAQYKAKLKEFVTKLPHKMEEMEVWTSTLKRTMQTAQPLKDMGYHVVHWRCLDEINAGVCDGMTYKEVQEVYPDEFAKRSKDKYNYRYPNGESYHDLMKRLEPLIMELERVKKPILIVCHQAVLRCLYAYLLDKVPETCVRTAIPLHTVFQFEVQSDGSAVVTPHELMDPGGGAD